MAKISYEDLKTFQGFQQIDEKIKFIKENRHFCEYLIRELNQGIDLDYVKQSEMIENNTEHELSSFILDENTKVLRSEPAVPWAKLREAKTREEYYEILCEQRDKSSLILVKDLPDGTHETTEYKNSGHLIALGYALRQARKDRKIIQSNIRVDMDSDFIEYVNERLILPIMPGGPTAGYGRYRSRVYRYGEFTELNVRVSGARFTTTPGARVYDEMQKIISQYNESDLHPILKALVFKVKFINIHPFSDFNGRTSRILLNYMLVRYGYPTITIKGRQRERYITAMEKAIIEGDYSDIITLIENLLNERCDKYISIIQEKLKDPDIDLMLEE